MNAQVQAPLPLRHVRHITMNSIIDGAAHANSADVFTGGPNAYRVGPYSSTPQPASQAYINGTGFAKVNFSRADRIYGNENDNRLDSMDSHVYGNGSMDMNTTMTSRTYGNGITRRSRNNHIHGPPQTIAGGFSNSNASAPDGSRYPFNNQNAPRQYPVNRVLFQGSLNNQFSALRVHIPHQVQFPTPLNMFNAPPDPFAAPGLARSVALADFIRSGALDDGQSLDPDARTPTTGSDRRQRRPTNSVQFTTPTRSRRDGYGNTHSSRQSSAMATPSRNMRSAGSYSTPNARAPASNLLHGQTLPPPAWMHEVLTQQPSLEEALTSLPFSNPYENVPVRGSGVVKFINIPYATLRSELISALGRSARPVSMPQGSPYYAVHIVMDRNTGKTGDGYVEVPTAREALNTVSAINRRGTDGSRALKIGNREVSVQLSSPEELMAALFPHATTVEWTGYTPRVIDVDTMFYPGAPGIGFTGFCGNEELAMLVKFAESPSRVCCLIFFTHRAC